MSHRDEGNSGREECSSPKTKLNGAVYKINPRTQAVADQEALRQTAREVRETLLAERPHSLISRRSALASQGRGAACCGGDVHIIVGIIVTGRRSMFEIRTRMQALSYT